MASIHGAQWDRDEAFRQSVIRKALLMGFSAEEYNEFNVFTAENPCKWRFVYEGVTRFGYASLYSAAFDYMRLLKVPTEVIGDYRG